MSRSRPVRLSVIGQDRDEVSFCDGSAAALRDWAMRLHGVTADESQAAAGLLAGLTELNRCRMPGEDRFEQLEMLRPFARGICNRISADALRQPLNLGSEGRRLLNRAQLLQYQLAGGYKVALASIVRGGHDLADPERSDGAGARATVALHRALDELAQTLLRALQLYTPAPSRLWEQLHQLFILAEHRKALNYRVRDDAHRLQAPNSIVEAYLRSLLLGSARPNMLRPEPLGVLFAALEDWSSEAVLAYVDEVPDHNLLVDLASDRGPTEAIRYVHRSEEDLRCLDTKRLRERLQGWLDGHDTESVTDLAGAANRQLLGHLVDAWGSGARRSFERSSADGEIELCVGLRALHYHSAGGIPLQQQLRGYRSVRGSVDPDVFEPDATAEGDEADAYPVMQVRVADMSPRGYRLVWKGLVHPRLETGELLGLREPEDSHWSIGAVRWCRNEPDAVEFGVEILAPQALTACVRPVSNDPSRRKWGAALILPEIEALEQPAHMITRAGRFDAGQKIALNQSGVEMRARLEDLERQTPSFDNFSFHELGSHAPPVDTGIEVEYIDF
ncbi:MAG: hypothetical protein JJU22_01615 [Gammaproteobacteria bacterium]|nr:hypothetical protein [Gammaproteobacteria bacterium]